MVGSRGPRVHRVAKRRSSTRRSRCSCTRSSSQTQRASRPRDDIITALLSGRGRRRLAVRHGLQPVLPAALGGGQRDDPQRHRARHQRVPRAPRPVQAAGRRPEGRIPGATEEILRWASPVMYFRRNVTKDTELRGETIKAGDKVSLWYISGQPRRRGVRRPVHVRHHARPEPAHRVRRRRPALLPRRTARRAWRSMSSSRSSRGVCPTSSSSASPPLRSNFIGGIKHLPVRFDEK